jgi:ABC-2 type transport system ATP-binding protein
VALWGANGAGKTTAIRCVLGLVRFDGAVEVAGHDLRADGRAVRRALGYVPQELALYDDLTARESLAFYARLKGVERLRVEEVLEEVGLSEHGNKRVSALSGGMKQRLALAAALLADPPLLVLDEMTSNLDTDARRGLLDLLGKQKERGKTILFTSHRFDEVEALADRVLVLEAGRLTTEVPPARLAEGLGVTARLRLYVDEPVVERAVEALRAEGFTARPNGHGVFVRVRSDRKTEPIRLLEERSIRVRNFEVETEVPSGGKSP